MSEKVLVFLFIVLNFTVCCRQASDQNKSNITAEKLIIEQESRENIIEVYHRFPSPQEMFAMLDNSEIMFNSAILNNVAKTTEYLDSKSQALNLGVYSSDLAYITAFKKFNESANYFEAIYQMSDNLQLSSAFDYNLLKRIQTNLTNSDSVKKLTDLALNSLNNYLITNDQEKIFAIIAIGGFVEALYISFNISGEYSENNILIKYIVDQKFVLENISNYSKLYNHDEAVRSSLTILEPLSEIYNGLKLIPEKTKVTKTSQGKLTIRGGNHYTISKDEFENLKEAAFSARKYITKN